MIRLHGRCRWLNCGSWVGWQEGITTPTFACLSRRVCGAEEKLARASLTVSICHSHLFQTLNLGNKRLPDNGRCVTLGSAVHGPFMIIGHERLEIYFYLFIQFCILPFFPGRKPKADWCWNFATLAVILLSCGGNWGVVVHRHLQMCVRMLLCYQPVMNRCERTEPLLFFLLLRVSQEGTFCYKEPERKENGQKSTGAGCLNLASLIPFWIAWSISSGAMGPTPLAWRQQHPGQEPGTGTTVCFEGVTRWPGLLGRAPDLLVLPWHPFLWLIRRSTRPTPPTDTSDTPWAISFHVPRWLLRKTSNNISWNLEKELC